MENVLSVVWGIGNETVSNPSTIPGHDALPRTTTYQEAVVDSYTNLGERYQCTAIAMNVLQSNNLTYNVTSDLEGKHKLYVVAMIKVCFGSVQRRRLKLSHSYVFTVSNTCTHTDCEPGVRDRSRLSQLTVLAFRPNFMPSLVVMQMIAILLVLVLVFVFFWYKHAFNITHTQKYYCACHSST